MSTKNLTQVQVAELAGLTDRGLRYLEAEGAGPMREPDGSYRPGAVAAWLRSRTDRRARSGDPADEFVELHNPGSAPVALGSWRFTDGIRFQFPPGAALAPGAFLVVPVVGGFLIDLVNAVNITVSLNLLKP